MSNLGVSSNQEKVREGEILLYNMSNMGFPGAMSKLKRVKLNGTQCLTWGFIEPGVD
jgi:hypothetical protein